MTRVAVLGSGSWGTAFAQVLADAGSEVTIWGRRAELCAAINEGHENPDYLPGIMLPESIRATHDPASALDGAEVVVLALPSQNLRAILTGLSPFLPERTVVVRHGMRASLTPILTIFGLDVGLLLGGAVLTESVFSLNGIGKYAIDALNSNDLPKVLGVVTIGAVFIVLANLIVDLMYAVIDPRVRLA